MILEKLTAELLQETIIIYLQYAYDSDLLREEHHVTVSETLQGEELLSLFTDETDARDDAHRCFTLRLGSEDYPHMKLSLLEAYYYGEFIFAVDCHDGFSFDSATPDYQKWLSLQNINRERKLEIERAWYDAGLATLRRLKKSALSRTESIRQFRGQEILLVDDDPDSAAIMGMILTSRGFRSHKLRSVKEVKAYLANSDSGCGLALIDIVLGDGNGVDVLHVLRADQRTRNIPIIFNSAMNRSDVQVQGMEHYLRKPFNANELVDMVEQIIHQEFDNHEIFLDKKGDE